MADKAPSLTRYLDPDAVARIAAIGLKPSAMVEGTLVGNHRSPFHGFAIEFAGRRQYVPGDDIKHIDWKVYYKSGRYMTKQYELETNFVAHLVVDVSESMAFTYQHGRKLDYAAFMAVALASAVVAQTDQVSATFFTDRILESIPASGSEEIVAKMSRYIDTHEPKDHTAVGRVLSHLAEQIGRRKLVFVISDFFNDVPALFDGIERLRYNRNEVVLFHLVDPIEIDFNYPGQVELLELEGARKLNLEGRNIRESYNALFGAYLDDLRRRARQYHLDYILCNTGENFGLTLAKYLNTRRLTGGAG